VHVYKEKEGTNTTTTKKDLYFCTLNTNNVVPWFHGSQMLSPHGRLVRSSYGKLGSTAQLEGGLAGWLAGERAKRV
jgi:hypothetical protein